MVIHRILLQVLGLRSLCRWGVSVRWHLTERQHHSTVSFPPPRGPASQDLSPRTGSALGSSPPLTLPRLRSSFVNNTRKGWKHWKTGFCVHVHYIFLKICELEKQNMLTLNTIMVPKLSENRSVCEISNRGFKEGFAKVHDTSNKTDLLGKVQSFLKGAAAPEKAEKHCDSYLCVPGIVEDRVPATPLGLWGEMVLFFIAIPSPFPEIKPRGGEKSQQFTFQTLKIVNHDNIYICPLAWKNIIQRLISP